jgi:DNA-binding HxlR family transcriptional regulator
MQRSSFRDMNCSVARTLDVVGEWWTPLILRDIALGISRFDALQRNLDISRKVLTQRLNTLMDEGIVQREPYQDAPTRYDYWLTEKGVELGLVLLGLTAWGDKWVFGKGNEPLLWEHTLCGKTTHAVHCCSECGEPLTAMHLHPRIGPGGRAGRGTSEVPAAIARLDAARKEYEAALAAAAEAGADV